MTKSEKALEYFSGNFNCAQSVLSAFAPDYGLDLETARKISTPLGAGLCHMREVCGAVAGALMVIGLAHGMSGEGDVESKDKAYALAREFADRFKARHETINCQELIGYDLGDPRQEEEARAEGVFDRICRTLVKDAVEILEELL